MLTNTVDDKLLVRALFVDSERGWELARINGFEPIDHADKWVEHIRQVNDH